MHVLSIYTQSHASSPTGVLHFGPSISGVVKTTIDTLSKQKIPHGVLDAEDANRRFSALNLPSNYVCAVEEEAGILRASVAVQALQVCVLGLYVYVAIGS